MNYKELFATIQTIAVVGISDKPDRPSHQVASYLQEHGFTIIPVNPTLQEALGVLAYPSILAIPQDIHIDVVDIFRKSEDVLGVVQEVIESGRTPLIWMQEGVISQEAKQSAEAAGMRVVMDRCMKKVHQALNR